MEFATVGVLGSSSLVSAEPQAVKTLRPWQAQALADTVESEYVIIRAPTGSGKTLLQKMLAVRAMRRGLKVLIAVPQKNLRAAFLESETATVDGERWEYQARLAPPPPVKSVVEFVGSQSAAGVMVCTHQALALALKQRPKWVSTFVIIDEAHHLQYTEISSNRIAKVATELMALGMPMALSTATWMRSDDCWVLPEEQFSQFTLVERSPEDHLQDSGLEVSLRVLCGPLEQAVEHVWPSEDAHTIAWLPSVASAVMRGRSKISLSEKVRERAGEGLVDLVDDSDLKAREKRLATLREDIARGRGPKTILALEIGKEGFDFPALTRAVMLSPGGSSVKIVQCLGRLLRSSPGKTRATFDMVCPMPVDKDPSLEELEAFLKTVLVAIVLDVRSSMAVAGHASRSFEKVEEELKPLLGAALLGADLSERLAALPEDVVGALARFVSRSRGTDELLPLGELGVALGKRLLGVVEASCEIRPDILAQVRVCLSAEAAEERLKAAVEAVRGGATCIKASKEFRVDPLRVAKACRAAGIEVFVPREGVEGRLKKAVEAVRGGASCSKAGKEFRVTPKRLSEACREAGIEVFFTHEGAEERLREAVEAVRGGTICGKAGKKFRVDPQRLSAACREAGIEVRRGPKKSLDRSTEA